MRSAFSYLVNSTRCSASRNRRMAYSISVQPAIASELRDKPTVIPDDDGEDAKDSGGTKSIDKDKDKAKPSSDEANDDDQEEKSEKIEINKAHELLNHPGETNLRKQAKQNNWKLTGVLRACGPCVKAKATAKPTKKTSVEKATKPGQRLYLDSSGPYKKTRGKNQYWALIVDEYTSRAWSFFSHEKT